MTGTYYCYNVENGTTGGIGQEPWARRGTITREDEPVDCHRINCVAWAEDFDNWPKWGCTFLCANTTQVLLPQEGGLRRPNWEGVVQVVRKKNLFKNKFQRVNFHIHNTKQIMLDKNIIKFDYFIYKSRTRKKVKYSEGNYDLFTWVDFPFLVQRNNVILERLN